MIRKNKKRIFGSKETFLSSKKKFSKKTAKVFVTDFLYLKVYEILFGGGSTPSNENVFPCKSSKQGTK